MKIGIILHPYGENKPAGLGEYIFELTRSLVEADEKNEYLIFLKSRIKDSPIFRGKNWQVYIIGFGSLWRDLGLFFAPRADIYIFNTPIMPIFFRPRKSVVIALDFAYTYFPVRGFGEYWQNKILFWLNGFSLRRADKIVAISEDTKKDVVRLFKVAEEKIEIIYPGFRNLSDAPQKELMIGSPYFLFTGVIKERKNVYNIVRAFLDFKKRYQTRHKLVIVGKGGGLYLEKILVLIKRQAMQEEIIFTGYIDLPQLVYLYKHAVALVFPSLVEGFGFPLLEAMSCGLPVITSDSSSLAEVAGGAALVVNPAKSEEITRAIHRLASDEILRKDLINKGSNRLKDFSWHKGAKIWTELLNKLT